MAWAPGGGGGARGSWRGVHRRDCQVCALVLVVLVGGLGSAEGKCEANRSTSRFIRCDRDAHTGDSKCGNKCGASWFVSHICCTADCCPPPDPPGPPPPPPPRGDCPPFKGGIFPAAPGVSTCATIDVVLAVLPRDAQPDDLTWNMWEQGLRMFQQRINRRGGIRIGQGKVGWLNLTIVVLGDVGVAGLVENYVDLSEDPYTDVLITPYDSSQARQVVQRLKESGCQKPVLSASGADAVFDVGYPNLWSVLRRTSEWVDEVATYLAAGAPQGLGATSVAIVYQNDTLRGDHGGITQVLLNRLEKLGLKLGNTAIHACRMSATDPTRVPVEDVHECTKMELGEKADVLIGIGGSTTFQVMTQDLHERYLHDGCDAHGLYTPKAAFFIAGGERQVTTKADTSKWMGTVMWSKTMPHTGPQSLPTDPYDNRLTEFVRYMGSPSEFAEQARSRLSTEKSWSDSQMDGITRIHAQGAATLLLLQLALEQAPPQLNPGGFGMVIPKVIDSKNNLDFRDPTFVAQLRQSMTSLNISTFWGQMSMDEKGSNTGFNIAVGQVQSDGSEKLVVPSQAEYPAEWPCDTAEQPGQQQDSAWRWRWMVVAIAIGATVVCCIGYYASRRISKRQPATESLLDKQQGRDSARQVANNQRWFVVLMGAYGALSVTTVVMFTSINSQRTRQLQLETWDLVCVLVTVGTLMCVPPILMGFKRQFADVSGTSTPALRVSEVSTGWAGAMMFVWGVVDLFLDAGQSVSLASCGHWWLFACSTVTFFATSAVSIYLGWHMLSRLARGSEEARSWIADHGKLAAVVVLASASRLESLAILRLRLCGRDIILLPIEPAFFHFIRHAGMFHFIIEDFPHGLVGVAQLTKAGVNSCGDTGTFHMPIDAKTITMLNVIFSIGSIVFGVILRSMQLLVLRAARDTDGGVPLIGGSE
eukprot:SAG25_NODE_26_length_21086_cov_21.643065_20_plen_929_part_00